MNSRERLLRRPITKEKENHQKLWLQIPKLMLNHNHRIVWYYHLKATLLWLYISNKKLSLLNLFNKVSFCLQHLRIPWKLVCQYFHPRITFIEITHLYWQETQVVLIWIAYRCAPSPTTPHSAYYSLRNQLTPFQPLPQLQLPPTPKLTFATKLSAINTEWI